MIKRRQNEIKRKLFDITMRIVDQQNPTTLLLVPFQGRRLDVLDQPVHSVDAAADHPRPSAGLPSYPAPLLPCHAAPLLPCHAAPLLHGHETLLLVQMGQPQQQQQELVKPLRRVPRTVRLRFRVAGTAACEGRLSRWCEQCAIHTCHGGKECNLVNSWTRC